MLVVTTYTAFNLLSTKLLDVTTLLDIKLSIRGGLRLEAVRDPVHGFTPNVEPHSGTSPNSV